MPPPADQLYRGVTRIFAAIIVGFGIAIITVTLVNGGGVTSSGTWIGVAFTLLGAGRLYLAMRARG